jgi:hypothetical protein
MSSGTLQLAPELENGELLFTIPGVILKLVNPPIFHLNIPSTKLVTETAYLEVVEDKKKSRLSILSTLGIELGLSGLGYQIDLPTSKKIESVLIRIKNPTNGQYSGTLCLSDQPAILGSKVNLSEFRIERDCYYLIKSKHPASVLAVSEGHELRVHEVDLESKNQKAGQWALVSQIGTISTSNKLTEWRGSRSTFVMYSPSKQTNTNPIFAILSHGEQQEMANSCVRLGAPTFEYVATKKLLNNGLKSVLFALKPNLSPLDITHLASAAEVDYPSFKPIVEQAAKEGKSLLVDKND